MTTYAGRGGGRNNAVACYGGSSPGEPWSGNGTRRRTRGRQPPVVLSSRWLEHSASLPLQPPCSFLRCPQFVGASIAKDGGADAVSLRLAEQYIAAFGRLAKAGNTLVLPSNAGDAAGMVAQAMAVFSTVRAGSVGKTASRGDPSSSSGGADGLSIVDLLRSSESDGAAGAGDDNTLGAGSVNVVSSPSSDAPFSPKSDFSPVAPVSRETAAAEAPEPGEPFAPKPF